MYLKSRIQMEHLITSETCLKESPCNQPYKASESLAYYQTLPFVSTLFSVFWKA